MKKSLMILMGTALLGSSAFCSDASNFKAFMTKMVPKVENAFNTKNTAFFDSIATDDFTEKDGAKTSTREQAMAEMKQMFSSAQSINVKFKVLSTSVKGDKATAMLAGHTSFVLKPQQKGDKSHKMVMDVWEKETWVKDGKGWKISVLEEAKPAKVWMDGKVMDPSKMGG